MGHWVTFPRVASTVPSGPQPGESESESEREREREGGREGGRKRERERERERREGREKDRKEREKSEREMNIMCLKRALLHLSFAKPVNLMKTLTVHNFLHFPITQNLFQTSNIEILNHTNC